MPTDAASVRKQEEPGSVPGFFFVHHSHYAAMPAMIIKMPRRGWESWRWERSDDVGQHRRRPLSTWRDRPLNRYGVFRLAMATLGLG